MGDIQPLPGYCLLLADPLAESLNSLSTADRITYSLDIVRVGDALLEVTGAYRINYETWGNREPALHTHITPRYLDEPWIKRRMPPGHAYPRFLSRRYHPERDGPLADRIRDALSRHRVD